MKKSSKILSILLVIIITTSVLLFQGDTCMASANTDNCFTIEYMKAVKIGNYYYRVHPDSASLQRKKVGTKKYKTILKNIHGNCLATTNRIYYVTYTYNGDDVSSTLYACNLNGKKKEKIATVEKAIELGNLYDNKLYVSSGNEWAGYTTYILNPDGTLDLEKRNLRIYSGQNGYMVGSIAEPTDVSPSSLCIYDTKTKKKTAIGEGMAPRIIGQKVYYASFSYETNTYTIKSCTLQGKKKTTLATLPENCMFVSYVCDKYVFYQCINTDGHPGEIEKMKF